MELYLIRHGLAAQRGDAYPDDTKRPLTRRGIEKLQQEVRALIALDITFDQVVTSPLVRTRPDSGHFRRGFALTAAGRKRPKRSRREDRLLR